MRALSATLQKNGTLHLASLISAERIVPDLVSREVIDFSSHDHAPVHLVILFVVPRRQYDQHLRMLAAIERLFHDDAMKRRLIESGTAREMLLTLQRRAPRAIAL
jgi:mannitol/fructose-specific phosphotransferase system IIA component (Ntr-type)